MGNSASSQGSSTGTHEGDVGSSISEEQHDWPIEQAADTPDVQSLQEMRKPYTFVKYKTRQTLDAIPRPDPRPELDTPRFKS